MPTHNNSNNKPLDFEIISHHRHPKQQSCSSSTALILSPPLPFHSCFPARRHKMTWAEKARTKPGEPVIRGDPPLRQLHRLISMDRRLALLTNKTFRPFKPIKYQSHKASAHSVVAHTVVQFVSASSLLLTPVHIQSASQERLEVSRRADGHPRNVKHTTLADDLTRGPATSHPKPAPPAGAPSISTRSAAKQDDAAACWLRPILVDQGGAGNKQMKTWVPQPEMHKHASYTY